MPKKIFVGLDVHKDTIATFGIDEDGRRLVESIIASETELVRRSLRDLADEVHITFEVGTQSNWLYRQTKPIVQRLLVCDPHENKLLLAGNKSDLIDAQKLAQLLRLNSLKEVWQHSREQLYLKELVRTYENLVTDSTRVMNRLKAIYRGRLIKTSDESFYQPEARAEWLAKGKKNGKKKGLSEKLRYVYLTFSSIEPNFDVT